MTKDEAIKQLLQIIFEVESVDSFLVMCSSGDDTRWVLDGDRIKLIGVTEAFKHSILHDMAAKQPEQRGG